MPNKNFNDLTIATTTDGTELVPVVSSGVTSAISVSNINSGIIADTISDVTNADDLSVGQSSIAAGVASLVSSITQQDLTGVNTVGLHRSPNAITSMFIYDTSKDSDGGAWTEKCQHTSWYNEPLSGKWLGAFPSESVARAYDTLTTGNEIISNGNFTTNTNGWTLGGTATSKNMSSFNGSLLLERFSGNGTVYAYQQITTVIGKTYRVFGNILNVNGPNLVGFIAYQTLGGTVLGSDYRNVSTTLNVGQYCFLFTATSTTTYILAQLDNNTNGSVLYDDISVMEVSSYSNQSNDYYQNSTDGKFYRLWKNLVTNSSTFVGWGNQGASATISAVAGVGPSGGTAYKLVPNAGSTYGGGGTVYSGSAVAGVKYSFSIKVKAAGYSRVGLRGMYSAATGYQFHGTIDLANNGAALTNIGVCPVTATPDSRGNGYYILKVEGLTANNGTELNYTIEAHDNATTAQSIFNGDGVSGIYLVEPQFEQGSAVTAYEENPNSTTKTEVFRGNKREFPKLSAIVAEAGSVTIYDLTESGRPMWMRFLSTGANSRTARALLGNNNVAVVAANSGVLIVGNSTNSGYQGSVISFPLDSAKYIVSIEAGTFKGTLADRNTAAASIAGGGYTINSTSINAVAMTVLLDAPVDPVTGLQVPTIAVGTSNGVSIISDVGTVYSVSTNSQMDLSFIKNRLYIDGVTTNSYAGLWAFDVNRTAAAAIASFNGLNVSVFNLQGNSGWGRGVSASSSKLTATSYNSGAGILFFAENKANPLKSSFAAIRDKYNTGHLIGDIRRTYLSDVDAGSVSATELATDSAKFSLGSYYTAPSATRLESLVDSVNVWKHAYFTGLTAGKAYIIKFDLVVTVPAGQILLGRPDGTYFWQAISSQSGVRVVVPASSSTNIQFVGQANTQYYFNNISIQEVVLDRSYKAQAANITGTLTKTPVATGSQLVAYSGFSA